MSSDCDSVEKPLNMNLYAYCGSVGKPLVGTNPYSYCDAVGKVIKNTLVKIFIYRHKQTSLFGEDEDSRYITTTEETSEMF